MDRVERSALVAERLPLLLAPWCSRSLVQETYGIPSAAADFYASAQRWAESHRARLSVVRGGEVNRSVLETFLQKQQLITTRWAAARLGMTESSLREVMGGLEARGPFLTAGMIASPYMISERFLSSVHGLFRETAHMIFSNHDHMCTALHAAIQSELGITVEPALCVTAQVIGEQPPDFAHDLDIFTGEPIGLRYQVWLDLKKPMNLKPDACSYVVFTVERATLERYAFPRRLPNLPEEKERLIQSAA